MLQRISIGVEKEKYEQLKNLSKPGMSIGFLIREAIDLLLEKLESEKTK